MKRNYRFIGLVGLSLSLASCESVRAQPPVEGRVLLKQTFEEGNNIWQAFGPESKAGITREAEFVKSGQAALRFDYPVERGKLGALVMPTPQGVPVKVKSFRFWVRPDYSTSLGMVLQEQDGGRYLAIFNAHQDTWQQVELSPADFIQSEDATDPKDPNNKLDLDKVQAIAIGDLKQLYAQSPNPDILQLLNVEVGPHTFYLDDMEVSETALPDVFGIANNTLDIDSFSRPQLSWISIGDVKISRVEDKALNNVENGHVLQASYRQAPGTVAGFAKRVQRLKWAGMQRLSFDVASLKPATLLVQLEEKGGGKYNTTVTVPGNNEIKHIDVVLADLKTAMDSNDANNKLDLDQVQQVLMLDVSGLAVQAEQDNILKISKVQASIAP